jgi:galactokinase
MNNQDIYNKLSEMFISRFGVAHKVAAYAPGRVEVLGNHTDYNEGLVLSAAINFGTFFVAIPRDDKKCTLIAGDIGEEVSFFIDNLSPQKTSTWSNYIIGVLDELTKLAKLTHGFDAIFLGNIPLGAGLSSSAALEVCAGEALSTMYNITISKIELAKIAQAAEHRFAGVKCGLLDQISSIYGEENALVMSDFRDLSISTLPLGKDACFLMCNTNAAHTLVDGAYNERRGKCEEAAEFFKKVLSHPVAALRDVSSDELQAYAGKMDPTAVKRAAHVIGENERVTKGHDLLLQGDLAEFGQLMFESHQSSIDNFENSCPELDIIVAAAKKVPGVLGARLSGGGFGGSAVVLLHPRDVEHAIQAIATDYEKQAGHSCDISVITPSSGAEIIA